MSPVIKGKLNLDSRFKDCKTLFFLSCILDLFQCHDTGQFALAHLHLVGSEKNNFEKFRALLYVKRSCNKYIHICHDTTSPNEFPIDSNIEYTYVLTFSITFRINHIDVTELSNCERAITVSLENTDVGSTAKQLSFQLSFDKWGQAFTTHRQPHCRIVGFQFQ